MDTMTQGEQYLEKLNSMLLGLEELPAGVEPNVAPILEDMCKFLHVERIEVTHFSSRTRELERKGVIRVYYDAGEADLNRFTELRKDVDSYSVDVFRAYHKIGDDRWTEEEYGRIDMMLRMLYSFVGRSHLKYAVDHLTFYDKDMSVHNMTFFQRHTEDLIARGRIEDFAVGYFDIKGLTLINKLLGRETGTLVMEKYCRMMIKYLDDEEIICRVTGDNFVILFFKGKYDFIKGLLREADVVYDEASNASVKIRTRAGFYLPNEPVNSPEDLFDRANAACNVARNIKKMQFVEWDADMAKQMMESKEVEQKFRKALEDEEFQVYYQPKVAIDNATLEGAEALCRWFHDGRLISPGVFIPVLEQTQAICDLDYYMLEHTCQDLRGWLDEGKRIVRVSVNFSRRHLADGNMVEKILNVIDKYRIPHEFIEIELTETTTDVDYQVLRQVVVDLRDASISTSVDDFGIGYSSLNLIRELPWKVIKLDKSFLKEDASGNGSTMLKHVIGMAHEMGLTCIAEGVETEEQIKLLKDCDCRLAQGFFFDRPVPKKVFEARL